MQIRDLIQPESIIIHADACSKEEAIHTLIDLHD